MMKLFFLIKFFIVGILIYISVPLTVTITRVEATSTVAPLNYGAMMITSYKFRGSIP
jgi:hypothetical protein